MKTPATLRKEFPPTLIAPNNDPRMSEWSTHPHCSWSRPPIRPLGTSLESWSGAVGIDRALSIYEASETYSGCIAHAHQLSPKDRAGLSRYMIELWRAFGSPELPEIVRARDVGDAA